MILAAAPDRRSIPAGSHSQRHLRVSLVVPPSPHERKRLPVNLALVLDRSGSMAGPKLALAKRAALQALHSLHADDRVSVVFYDETVDVVVPSTLATADARRKARSLIDAVRERGSTDLCAGWLRGCEQVATNLREGTVPRCLLLTDGLANHGITDRGEIAGHAEQLRRRGIQTSTFGVGDDFDETLLSQMAQAGGGNFYFIELPTQIPDFVASEVGEALDVVAREAALLVTAPHTVEVVSLNDHPIHRAGNVTRVELGSLVSEQELTAILSLRFPPGEPAATCAATLTLDDADGFLSAAPLELSWTYVADTQADSEPKDPAVARAVVEILATRARERAQQLNRADRYDEARSLLQEAAKQLRTYAAGDPDIVAIAKALEDSVEEYSAPMDKMAYLKKFYGVYASKKGRGVSGQALRTSARRPSGFAATKVVVLPTTARIAPLAEEALEALAAARPEIRDAFSVDDLLVQDSSAPDHPGILDEAAETALLEAAAQAPEGLRIVLTPFGLADHWFSHWHATRRTAIASLHAWPAVAAVPELAFIAYELVLHGLRVFPDYSPEDLMHEDTRACLFDFCADKTAIAIKLETGGLCDACRAHLAHNPALLESVLSLTGAVRALATAASQVGARPY
jgi:Ca-activated chloride channel homolog